MAQNISLNIFLSVFASLFFASLAVSFWLLFWLFYSKKKTTPFKLLSLSFFLGIISALISGSVEKILLPGFLASGLKAYNYFGGWGHLTFNSLAVLFASVVFFIVLPEEITKFLIFKIALFKRRKFDQIIDGIKFGIFLGLGFAFIENAYFFFLQIQNSNFCLTKSFFYLFIARLLITTIAHSLYGGILGYYFGLAKFYKIFRAIFLWQGFFAVLIVHSIFDFLILGKLSALTFALIMLTLIILFQWYNDRRSFQIRVSRGVFSQRKPLFSEKKEIQAIIAKETGSNFKMVKKLGFCPYCFGKIKKGEKICHNCGRKL